MLEEIKKRCSSRVFDENYEIENTAIEELIRAASYAPSLKNKQPWEFIVLKGKEKEKFVNYLLDRVDKKEDKNQYVLFDKRVVMRSLRIMKSCSATVFLFTDKESPFLAPADYLDAASLKESARTEAFELTVQKYVDYADNVMEKISIGCAVENLNIEATAQRIDTLCLGFGMYFAPEIIEYFDNRNEFMLAIALGKSLEPEFQVPKKDISDILIIKE